MGRSTDERRLLSRGAARRGACDGSCTPRQPFPSKALRGRGDASGVKISVGCSSFTGSRGIAHTWMTSENDLPMTYQPSQSPGDDIHERRQPSQPSARERSWDRTLLRRPVGSTSSPSPCAPKACYEEAEALARQALAAFEAETGPDHPDIANILNTLAGVHEDRGDYAEAERLYQRRSTSWSR